jgi:L-alanine-DL-glutamate epimerase-like enolase superfamily enzyme
VVAVETDAGITGYAECCPLGSAYLPSYAIGVRAGISGIRPQADRAWTPRTCGPLNRSHGRGAARPPLCQGADRHRLLGHPGQGRRPARPQAAGWHAEQEKIALYRAISARKIPLRPWPAKIAGYRTEGYTKFQLKVGGDPNDDIRAHPRLPGDPQADTDILVCDANTGWTMADAARVVNAVADLDVYIEQPCMSYEESVSMRRRTSLPFVLDENIGTVGDSLLKGIAEDALDVPST